MVVSIISVVVVIGAAVAVELPPDVLAEVEICLAAVVAGAMVVLAVAFELVVTGILVVVTGALDEVIGAGLASGHDRSKIAKVKKPRQN